MHALRLTLPNSAHSVLSAITKSVDKKLMSRLITAFMGNRLTARILRSASWVLVGYGGSQAIRLASNLILTRLLFPEAFGLMTLVTVVTVGLMMFSDVGIGPSIAQSKRGDDPDFLNTAWTIQIIRGSCLWLVTVALAYPMARFYDQPELAVYLPISGLALLLSGLLPTRIETAHRHLVFGRLTLLDLTSQIIGVLCMVVLAYLTKSVMALVVGGVLGVVAKLILTHLFMPGEHNKFCWEKAALSEQVHFGKWIFLSTAFGFVSAQGDKAILGKLLSLDMLGIYNIGFFLASFPVALGLAMAQNLLIPIYRDRPPGEALENRKKLQKMRFLITSGLFIFLMLLAFFGPLIVRVLYDARYEQAGAMLVIVACALLPQAIGLSYDRAALAAGDSRGVFVFAGVRAVLQVSLLYLGFQFFGLFGGLVSIGIAMALAHPMLIRLAKRHDAWDPVHDGIFAIIAVVIILTAYWMHAVELEALRTI